jgi:hypothetical protein
VNTIKSSPNIVAFREFLRARFPEAHAPQMPEEQPLRSGVSCVESLHLSKGTITEVVAAWASAGVGLLISGLLQRDGACRELTALVDGSDAFDPWSIEASALERLLWVRCRAPDAAIRATDLLLRDGNIPLVLLDLQMQAPRAVQGLPSSVWHRLRMLAEKSGTMLCAFTPVRTVPCARARVRLDHRFQLADQFQDRNLLLQGLPVQVERQRQPLVLPAADKAIA